MPRYARRTARRRRPVMGRRRKVTRRTARASRYSRPTAAVGSSTVLLNRQPRRRPVVFTRSNVAANAAVGAGAAVSQMIFFDPAGTYSNIDGSAPSTAMTDWTSLTGLYDQYKVKKIRLRFMLTQVAGTAYNTQNVVMYGRYSYDSQINATAIASYQALPNVKVHYFTAETPMVEAVVYPRVEIMDYNTSGALATIGAALSKPRWQDVNFPARLMGYAYYIPNLPTNWTLSIDCEYTVAFKYNL